MSLLEGIYARLAADAGVLALNAGVFPALAPKESSLPYLVYTQVGGATVNSLAGANRLQSARLRFSCYGNTYGTAKGLAKAVKDSLNGLAVTLPGGTVAIQGAWLEYEGDDAEPDLQGTVFATHVDFSLMFAEVA
jgi:hypothetical protein